MPQVTSPPHPPILLSSTSQKPDNEDAPSGHSGAPPGPPQGGALPFRRTPSAREPSPFPREMWSFCTMLPALIFPGFTVQFRESASITTAPAGEAEIGSSSVPDHSQKIQRCSEAMKNWKTSSW
ncbi:hypothetical protein GN956_G18989 [Arapaima gigas]